MQAEVLLHQKLFDPLQPSDIFALLFVPREIVEVLQESAIHADILLQKVFKVRNHVRVELR